MSRSSLVLASVITGLITASPAVADQAKTITATGTAQIKVLPRNRNSNSSIKAAVQAAQQAAVPAALHEAHEYGLQYAQAVGLTLGPVLSVSDAPSSGFGFGPYAGPFGIYSPFGPNQFCGISRPVVVKRVAPNRPPKVIRLKPRRVCIIPPFVSKTLTVTYSAT
jgi:hypothetical protein